MTAADCLMQSLVDCGVEVCFANPGTTEMHLVRAIDVTSGLRPILGLFEGVCTGAADGYGRMTGRPAATLLHLGPGLANGLANLHNTRRARTPIVNVVGDHATYHLQHNAPLTSDIGSLAAAASAWVRFGAEPRQLAQDGADAVAAALTVRPEYQGQVATLVVPSDVAWAEVTCTGKLPEVSQRPAAASAAIDEAARVLGERTVLLVDGAGSSESALRVGSRIAATTGCRHMIATFAARVEGGPGRPVCERLAYFPHQAMKMLDGVEHLVLAGAESPITFFGYPNTPSSVVPEGCQVHVLARSHEDVESALRGTADAVGAAPEAGRWHTKELPPLPTGTLTAAKAADVIANVAPDECVVALDTGGGKLAYGPMQKGVRCSWLPVTGGSIGQGGPVATGAAVACPDSQVLALLGDGGAMYTNQALWTQAREGLNVTTLVYSNRRYGILEYEYERLGLPSLSARGASMFDLHRPAIDWVQMSRGLGVPAVAVETCDALRVELEKSFAESGPHLLELKLDH